MSLDEHARRELLLCGQVAQDPQYAEGIIATVRAFAAIGGLDYEQRLSAVEQLAALLRMETLSPLTDNPAEWSDVSERFGGRPMWQSTRQPEAFSTDGGRTYTVIGAGDIAAVTQPSGVGEASR